MGLVSVAIGNGTRKAITRHHAGQARCDRLQSTLKIQVDAEPRPKATVEVADTAALAPDGRSATIDVTASCARGWQVLEAFIQLV